MNPKIRPAVGAAGISNGVRRNLQTDTESAFCAGQIVSVDQAVQALLLEIIVTRRRTKAAEAAGQVPARVEGGWLL